MIVMRLLLGDEHSWTGTIPCIRGDESLGRASSKRGGVMPRDIGQGAAASVIPKDGSHRLRIICK